MNSTPLHTATAVGAGAVVAPVIAYFASLFHVAMPADVQGAIVVLIVAGAHWLSQVMGARSAKSVPKVVVAQ